MKRRTTAVRLLATALVLVEAGSRAEAQQEVLNQQQVQEVATSRPVAGPSVSSSSVSSAPVVQVTTNGPVVVQDQPLSVIEDSPLALSPAERRRRERQALEAQTESRIVERLEEARIEEEKARVDRLFKNGFGSRDQTQQTAAVVESAAPKQVPTDAQQKTEVIQPQVQIIQIPAAAVQTQPAEAQAQVAKGDEKPERDIKQEVKAALDELTPKVEVVPPPSYYIQAMAGVGEYIDVVNMKSRGATGFAIGLVTADRLVAEGSFQYSQYDIELVNGTSGYAYSTTPFKRMSQYNFVGALKYQLLPGRVKPLIGALAGYTRRTYEDQQQYPGYGTLYSGDVSSNAFDMGALLGLDVQVTSNFALGFEYRYMRNVSYTQNTNTQQSFVTPTTVVPVEEQDYSFALLTGRFTF